MPLKPHILRSESAHIDHTDEIRLARLNLDSQVLRVVDQSGLWDRFSPRWVRDANEALEQLLHPVMVPVGESQNNLLIVQILVRVFRIMHDQRATETIWILASLVAVVPVCSWLVDLLTHQSLLTIDFKLAYRKVVRKRAARKDTTLRNRNRPIHMRCPILVQAMEMQRRTLVTQRVLDVHDDSVTFGSDDGFNRPPAVYSHHRARLLSIWIRVRPGDVEVVCDGRAVCDRGEKR
jgi:hypothetical protein